MSAMRLLTCLVSLAAVVALAGIPSVDGVAGTVGASADQTYTDRSGDTIGRLDILTVRATSTSDVLSFRVNLAQPTIGTTEHTGIELDLNGDNRRDIEFYFDGVAGGTLKHIRYPTPGVFETTPSSLGTTSNNSYGITFNLRLAALGTPTRVQFSAFTKERDEPRTWDDAPDSGWWLFVVQETTPPPGGGGGGGGTPSPDFVAKGSAMTPNPPRAGDSVAVGTRFVYRATGKTVTDGRLSCRGRVGARSVSGLAVRDNRLHACVFDLPRNAGGELFTGQVTLTVGARKRSVERTSRVVSASALRIEGPNTIPAAATAGQQFSAGFKVELVQPGKPPKRITNGAIECFATVGGRSLRFDYTGWKGNTALCAWNLPSSARGKVFQGTISVTAGALSASKSFSRRVR